MARKKIEGVVEEQVFDLYARGLSPLYISKELAKQDIHVSRQAIEQYVNNPIHNPKVSAAIDKYRSNPLAVAMAHKRVRLEDLNTERMSLIATLRRFKKEDGSVKDKKYNKYLTGLKRLIEVEIAGREEIEKKPDLIALFQRTGPYGKVEDADLRRVEQEITEKLLIITRQDQINGKSGGNQERKTPASKGKPA